MEVGNRAILEAAPEPEAESFPTRAARLRATTPPDTGDSTALIRAARDGADLPPP